MQMSCINWGGGVVCIRGRWALHGRTSDDPIPSFLCMAKTLYVGNVPWRTTNEALQTHFSSAGMPVTSVTMIMDRVTNRSRGFAFVEIPVDDDLSRFIERFNEQEFEGRKLYVKEALPREERPRRA